MSDIGDTPSPRSSAGRASSTSPPPAPPSSTTGTAPSPKKRASLASEGKVTKRRAARACVSCRARKVRCDVVEGAPCGNCRWDDVECVVQESRRRKKNLSFNCGPSAAVGARAGSAEVLRAKGTGALPPIITANLAQQPTFTPTTNGSFSLPLMNGANGGQAATNLLYQQPNGAFGTPGTTPASSSSSAAAAAAAAALAGFPPVTPAGIPASPADLLHPLLRSALEHGQAASEWPAFVKPIPDRILAEDRRYLVQKQVFALPSLRLQNALLAAYVEYVHPYMPLVELLDFLTVVNDRSGAAGKVSLFLYHAVMFAATAFVDESLLKEAGFDSRRDARRAFFSRTRLLYDFDYETDRLILVQGLLLMTYWYETPDDQKDTWHWMGVAISLAHTIGLHRDPAKTAMIPRKQKLWKRVWWSCLMRDRLVALGMRRPTRIKSEDFDVPPLDEADFEIGPLPEDNQLLGPECALVRDTEMQRALAVMCIEKAKLCMLIGNMLKVQYSVLSRSGVQPENTTNSTHMLLPNKNPENMKEVENVDDHLRGWFTDLPECCRYRPLDSEAVAEANKVLAVQRNLLHMIYHTTISALHRPLFLPASPTEGPGHPLEVQETARQRVREAAEHITRMAAEMRQHSLERYLPTTGVTVILPAMIVHMLDTKSLVPEMRAKAIQGLRECLLVMHNLRNIYAAADFATGFLDALLRKGMLGGAAQQQPPQPQPAPAPARSAKMLNRVLAPALNLTPQGGGSNSSSILIPERPSTPPPDINNTTARAFLHSSSAVNNLYPPSITGHHPFVNPDAESDLALPLIAAAAAGAATPPQTDSEDVSTPRGDRDRDRDMDMDLDVSMAEVDGHAHHALLAFGYTNAVANGDGAGGTGGQHGGGGGTLPTTGNNFDFDQWLQFPAEAGLSSTDVDDSLMGGMFHQVDQQQQQQQQEGMELGGVEGGEAGIQWLSLGEGISH
ncbi:hypothetical protein N658DRAFT_420567 [Parathielavia hyrcaniae]|uniref:Zn(2)-C6 fungal-type domain-containing protein n=1 Tax=Parathielavia hyrcaniae TaxID=113614 RepID=A0AAN6Q845_9PEZI|nr:hypothetical protein N658DRAFT_420567 [Parathielavia hyrcaniae]